MTSPEDTCLWKFEPGISLQNWVLVNDDVMGGRSQSELFLDEEGHGVFEGRISLENRGGFASLRYRGLEVSVANHSKVILRLQGDGHSYQFRVKASSQDRASYVSSFPTSGDWETIEIPLDALYPRFRGQNLDGPNFNAPQIVEWGFLIAPGKAESFRLKIDEVILK